MDGPKLGSNISSLRAQRNLAETSSELSSVFERLSSGLRINKASDDAAGLALASSLASDSGVYRQAIRNVNDGISLANIADSVIQELTNITTRLRDLAGQASSGSYTSAQRKALDTEAQALKKEYLRIIQSTRFNEKDILEANQGSVTLQAGYGSDGSITGSLGGVIGTGVYTGAGYIDNTAAPDVTGQWIDVTSDGIADLITVGNSGGQGRVTVRVGLGGGNFGAATSFASLVNLTQITVGDINNDGNYDIVAWGSNAAENISVMLGNGSGSFAVSATYEDFYATVGAVALGDINSDGFLDMVSSSAVGTAQIQVRLGNGNGTFSGSTTFINEATVTNSIQIVDINNDSNLDLVTSGSTAGVGFASVRLGTGGGGFGNVTSYSAETFSTVQAKVGDFNNDGVVDLLTAGTGGGASYASIRLGSGTGTFGSITSMQTYTIASYDLEIADLNGDGNLDFVTGGTNAGLTQATISVSLGNGNGTFATALTASSNTMSNATSISLVDINTDGVYEVGVNAFVGGTGRSVLFQPTLTQGTAPLLNFYLGSVGQAKEAMSLFTQKLDQLTVQRGSIAALQSRAEVAVSNLQSLATNLETAASRITEIDAAAELARMVSLQIKQQAATAVMAQANQQPEIVLSLLESSLSSS